MITAVNNSPSFTSVIPLKVRIDGMQTFDEKLVKSACKQLGSVLTGIPNTNLERNMKHLFAEKDPSYYIGKFVGNEAKPSDFLGCVRGQNGDMYLFTGPHAEALKESGKAIEKETSCCKKHKLENSFDLFVAKKQYAKLISKFIASTNSRIKDEAGKLLTLNIDMSSNKKYGMSTFKTKLNGISFTS